MGRKPTIVTWPSKEALKRARNRLPRFKPYDLRLLSKDASSSERRSEEVAARILRQRVDGQLKQLLTALHVDLSKKNKWALGFSRLAAIYQGVGGVQGARDKPTTRRSAWTPEQDAAFQELLLTLKMRGYSGRKAVREIANNPKYNKLFPYRPKRSSETGRGESGRREEAYWKRRQKLRSQGNFLSALQEIFRLNEL